MGPAELRIAATKSMGGIKILFFLTLFLISHVITSPQAKAENNRQCKKRLSHIVSWVDKSQTDSFDPDSALVDYIPPTMGEKDVVVTRKCIRGVVNVSILVVIPKGFEDYRLQDQSMNIPGKANQFTYRHVRDKPNERLYIDMKCKLPAIYENRCIQRMSFFGAETEEGNENVGKKIVFVVSTRYRVRSRYSRFSRLNRKN